MDRVWTIIRLDAADIFRKQLRITSPPFTCGGCHWSAEYHPIPMFGSKDGTHRSLVGGQAMCFLFVSTSAQGRAAQNGLLLLLGVGGAVGLVISDNGYLVV